VVTEYKEWMDIIADLLHILATPSRVTTIITDELRKLEAVLATSVEVKSL